MREISIEEQKKLELDILDAIDLFCSKNNIKYCLAGGTLLGAVRHKGFIPWDDDIDISMLREDYEKFVKTFNDNRTDSLKLICYKNTQGYHLPYAKIVDTRTIVKEKNTDYRKVVSLGVFVDVFPLDYVSNDEKKILKQYKKEDFLSKLVIAKSMKKEYIKNNINNKFKWGLLRAFVSLFSLRTLVKRKDKLAQKYSKQKNPIFVATMVVMTYGLGEIQKLEWYKENKILFEGKMYSAPKNYDAILKGLYNDYMTPPPEDKRVNPHTAKAYWLQ